MLAVDAVLQRRLLLENHLGAAEFGECSCGNQRQLLV